MGGLSRYLSIDDLWSLIGYVLILVLALGGNPDFGAVGASFLASGMLALFWLASRGVRERNRDRNPNARVIFWALVAVASAVAYSSR